MCSLKITININTADKTSFGNYKFVKRIWKQTISAGAENLGATMISVSAAAAMAGESLVNFTEKVQAKDKGGFEYLPPEK